VQQVEAVSCAKPSSRAIHSHKERSIAEAVQVGDVTCGGCCASLGSDDERSVFLCRRVSEE